VCRYIMTIGNDPSVFIAWLAAVSFAFIANKYFVFDSRGLEKKDVAREAFLFWLCRAMTGAAELAAMHVLVEILGLPGMAMKLLTNIAVIVLNYIASKLLIFRKKG